MQNAAVYSRSMVKFFFATPGGRDQECHHVWINGRVSLRKGFFITVSASVCVCQCREAAIIAVAVPWERFGQRANCFEIQHTHRFVLPERHDGPPTSHRHFAEEEEEEKEGIWRRE